MQLIDNISKPFTSTTALLLLVAACITGCGKQPTKQAPAPTQPKVIQSTALTTDGQAAVKLTMQLARLQSVTPPEWEVKDTTNLTQGKQSFGLFSKRHDQKILFILWDNASPSDRLDLITIKVPFTNYAPIKNIKIVETDTGQRLIQNQQFSWFVGKYPISKDNRDKTQMCFVGSYRSTLPDKAIVVIAQPFSDNEILDYQTTLWLIDSMAAPTSNNTVSNSDTIPPVTNTSTTPKL